jgi:hypothetical protein
VSQHSGSVCGPSPQRSCRIYTLFFLGLPFSLLPLRRSYPSECHSSSAPLWAKLASSKRAVRIRASTLVGAAFPASEAGSWVKSGLFSEGFAGKVGCGLGSLMGAVVSSNPTSGSPQFIPGRTCPSPSTPASAEPSSLPRECSIQGRPLFRWLP